jgi:hypothetical protein
MRLWLTRRQTSEEYLDKVNRIPPIIVDGPSPGQTSLDMTQPDEGSIAEKEDGAVGYGEELEEKHVEMGTAPDVVEKERGFFSPKFVDKELAGLGVGYGLERSEMGRD